MCPLHPGTKLSAPATVGAMLRGSGLGRALSRSSVCDMEGEAGQRSARCLNHPCTVVGWTGCCGEAGCPVLLGSGDKGMCCSALDCRQGCEFSAVLPWMQVNRTLDTIPDKVQEQSQEVVARKQGFVCCLLLGFLLPFSSHSFLEAFPAALAVPRCHHANVILGHDCPFPILSESSVPCRTQAAAHNVSVSLFLAESQDQLGLIRQEIRRLQEELPLLGVEEKVGAFVSNATSVLEKYREPIIAWDGVRWARGCSPGSIVWRVLRLLLLQLLEVGACWVVGAG